MPRRGITSKVVKSTIANKDVMGMFHDVIGTGEGGGRLNLRVVWPKFVAVKKHCDRFVRLLDTLARSNLLTRFSEEREHLGRFVAGLAEARDATLGAPDLAAAAPPTPQDSLVGDELSYAAVPEEARAEFERVYRKIKESDLVTTVVVTCKNLALHKKALWDPQALNDHFLTHSAGLTFAPIDGLLEFNVKAIYNDQYRMKAADRRFLLTVLHKMYRISHDVYDAVSMPDVDVDEFVEVIIRSLDDVEGQIPRCNDAFRRIRESVGLLKGNFNGYYQDYIASNNPTIIMENFVLDVSKSTDANAKVTGQFRRIISHYRKQAKAHASNPRMKTLFEQVDKNFQELERRERNADADDAAAADGSDSDDAPPSLAAVEGLYAKALEAAKDGGDKTATCGV
jgi:hypothetical protein